MEKDNNIHEEEFLKKVEKAAEKGASKGGKSSSLLSFALTLILVFGAIFFIDQKFDAIGDSFKQFLGFDVAVENHDLTLDNNSFLGYTAADFEEAVLGDSSKLKKLEVFEQKISDVANLTDTGLFNWKVFTKVQLITYHGTVVYTVDLGVLKSGDITLNEEEKIVTIAIPHASQEEININEKDIQFGDTSKGLLAFGDISVTPEQMKMVQEEARNKMQIKIDEEKLIETADRFTKLAVWEIYSPIVKGVASNYSLEVIFKD